MIAFGGMGAYRGILDFDRARDRLVGTILNPPRLVDRCPYWGLGLWRSWRWLRAREMRPPPFGWRYLKADDLAASILLPLWLYWPVYCWTYRRTFLYGPLIRLGLWRVAEGDYYVNGRWAWRWWETLRARRFPERPREWHPLWPATRWERFGWRIGRLLDRMDATMPRWTA